MFFPMFDPTMVLLIPALLFSLWAQIKVKGAWAKWSQVPGRNHYTGAEVARRILQRNNIHDVSIKMIPGNLSDHYNPGTRELALSQGVHDGTSIASLAVAAHEVGHALQHASGYAPLVLRSTMVPAAGISTTMAMPLFLIGLFIRAGFLMDLGIILFSVAVLFYLVTLPVEYNASARAVRQLTDGSLISPEEERGARSMLNAAALTYLAAALMALLQLLRLLALRGSRD